MKAAILVLPLGVALGLPLQVFAQAPAQEQIREETRATQSIQAQERERIYGYELMTPQERAEYQTRMRAAKTEQERAAIRQEHHEQMQVRAKAQGKTLPDEPPADRGPGMGPGGGGMGPGGRGGY